MAFEGAHAALPVEVSARPALLEGKHSPSRTSPFRTLYAWLQGGKEGPCQWADLPPTTSAVLGSFLAYLSAPRPDGECCYVGSGVGVLLATALSASADEASMLDHATQAVLLAIQLDILLEESKVGKADWESIVVATTAGNSWPEDIFVSARMRDKVELTGRHACECAVAWDGRCALC